MINFKTNINFMKLARYIFPVSIIIMLISICLVFLMEMNLGIDFTSGTRFDMTLLNDGEEITPKQIEEAINQTSLDNFTVKELKSEKTDDAQIFSIISQKSFDEEEIAKTILESLQIEPESYQSNQATTISPKMGSELVSSAALSLGVAIILILVYITIRFNSFFALSSILALIHDVSITIGVFILFDLEISLPIIAAFLTILGYSLNDTIVVFDRIRENLKLSKKNEDIFSITNKSVNQTLSRTLLTSLTTLIVLIILYFIGSYLIKLFTFALIIGVIIGTYSSIFIAGFSFTMLYNKYSHLLNKPESEENEN